MSESNPVPFYFHPRTGKSYYSVPPSCAWTRTYVDGHPMYVNTVTHQSRWSRPPALSWRLLHAPGQRSTCASSSRHSFRHLDLRATWMRVRARMNANPCDICTPSNLGDEHLLAMSSHSLQLMEHSSLRYEPRAVTLQDVLVQLCYRRNICGRSSRASHRTG